MCIVKQIVMAMILFFLMGLSRPLYGQEFAEKFQGSIIGVADCSLAWGDYDNDGDLDILVTGTYNNVDSATSRIYQNTGNGFVEVFAGTLAGVEASSATWGDYDNDGDLDIIIMGLRCNYVGCAEVAKIYQNTGNGFTEVFAGSLPDIAGGNVAWGDYDNDGDLDIVITGTPANYFNSVTKIYQNGGNRFTEVFAGSLPGLFYGAVAWGDYDNDGYLDIVIGGMDNNSTIISKIYKNTGNGFVESYPNTLTGIYAGSVAWGDYDGDGDLDILLTGWDGSNKISKIYQNSGNSFSEVFIGALMGVSESSVAWGDYDNDGDLDILLAGSDNNNNRISKIYQNTGAGFIEGYSGSLEGVAECSVKWGDYDNDGDLDILLAGRAGTSFPYQIITKIYENIGGTFNTKPTTPTGLNASINGSNASLSWNKSNDLQTSQNALTYNIRLGTLANSIDIQSPMSDAGNGKRLIVALGNVNQNTSWTIKNLPQGKYYWSVQAIDNNFAGSAFANEETFDICETATPIYKTVYYGYLPQQCVTLSTSTAGLTGPFSYTWNTGAIGSSINVCPTTNTSYILNISHANGCRKVTFNVNVIDVRCGNGKVNMCHVPNNDPTHEVTMCISQDAVAAHLAQGCHLGQCAQGSMFTSEIVMEQNYAEGLHVEVLPNPSNSYFTLRIETDDNSRTSNLNVFDIQGRLIESKNKVSNIHLIQLGSNYLPGIYLAEILIGNRKRLIKLIKL